MKTFSVSSTVLLAAILLPLAAAQFRARSDVSNGNCSDGRLCSCKSFLEDGDYQVVRRRVNCLTQVGTDHHFMPGSQERITKEVCQFYKEAEIQGPRLMKCIFKDIGMVVNVNGVDQWDLAGMRLFFIEQRSKDFPGDELLPIRTIILTTYYVCPADKFDFSKFPFDDCWERAVELLKTIADSPNSVAKSAPIQELQATPAAITQFSLANTYNQDAVPSRPIADYFA